MSKNHENLEKLLATFMSEKHAARFAEDIRSGEKLLADNPAPAPSDELLTAIKARIAADVVARKARRRIYIGRLVAAAAAIVLVSVAALMYFSSGPEVDVHYAAVEAANPDFYDSTTEHIAMITDELDSIEDSFFALYSTEPSDYQFFSLQEYEGDIDELEESLWKG